MGVEIVAQSDIYGEAAVHAHEVLHKTGSKALTVSTIGIGVRWVDPDVRQGQTLEKEFESGIVAGRRQPEGSQVLKAIQSVGTEIQRPVELEPSEFDAEFQGVTTDGARQLVLSLVNCRKIAQRECQVVADQAQTRDIDRSERLAWYQRSRQTRMRIIDRRGCSRPVDAEAQLIDPSRPECRAVLNSAILIPRQVKGGESWRIRSRGRPDVWNQRGTVIHGVAREERMGIGKVVIDANHAVVLTGVAFVRGDQFAGSIPIVRSVRDG